MSWPDWRPRISGRSVRSCSPPFSVTPSSAHWCSCRRTNSCYAFNLIRMPTTDDSTAARRLVAANRAIYDRVHAAGGTLHPVSVFPMSPDEWRDHFGPAWTRLRDAKERFDPRHVLTPGYEVFSTP